MELFQLSTIERNVLIASVFGDGAITKLYPGSRRRNNSYREHFSSQQLDYRIWKLNLLPANFYFNKAQSNIFSPSLTLFTEMFPYFYNPDGNKIISDEILKLCTSPIFLTTLFLDDGSLSISVQRSKLKKLIYLTPHIYLYLQCFSQEDLIKLQTHIHSTFLIKLKVSKRSDGFGYVLKTTKVSETMKFLEVVLGASADCPSMFYKTNWNYRFEKEVQRYKESDPDYEVIASSSERSKNYSDVECNLIILMKTQGYTNRQIAEKLGRSYWSVVYKWREIRER
ncbi:DNA endonuclease [Planococcus salinarum]|uniref:DNA endonuclease n=1 Tax=Planococcus salinarum TaxID=622695 RepID=UPI000E3D979D|nr:DNA endonuclease [Planococcus salinarum]TAA72234.1 DNA endonuclease [Planococcus salinarum]